MGIAMVIDIFDFFSKMVSQIHFKLGWGVPWVGFYQVCSIDYSSMIFGFFVIFLYISGEDLKKTISLKILGQLP